TARGPGPSGRADGEACASERRKRIESGTAASSRSGAGRRAAMGAAPTPLLRPGNGGRAGRRRAGGAQIGGLQLAVRKGLEQLCEPIRARLPAALDRADVALRAESDRFGELQLCPAATSSKGFEGTHSAAWFGYSKLRVKR